MRIKWSSVQVFTYGGLRHIIIIIALNNPTISQWLVQEYAVVYGHQHNNIVLEWYSN